MKQQQIILVGPPLWLQEYLAEVGAIQMGLEHQMAVNLEGLVD